MIYIQGKGGRKGIVCECVCVRMCAHVRVLRSAEVIYIQGKGGRKGIVCE